MSTTASHRLRCVTTGELADVHRIGEDDEGRVLYQGRDGWNPWDATTDKALPVLCPDPRDPMVYALDLGAFAVRPHVVEALVSGSRDEVSDAFQHATHDEIREARERIRRRTIDEVNLLVRRTAR